MEAMEATNGCTRHPLFALQTWSLETRSRLNVHTEDVRLLFCLLLVVCLC